MHTTVDCGIPVRCTVYADEYLDLEKVSEEVRASEPGTVQYQITQGDEDENEILIWEEVSRYPSTLRPSPLRPSPLHPSPFIVHISSF